MQFTYPGYYTGYWAFTLSFNVNDNINKIYSNHIVELLTYLNDCQIFKMTGYTLNREEFYTDNEESYTKIFLVKAYPKIKRARYLFFRFVW